MAKEAKAEAPVAEATPPKKSKKLLIMIAAALVVVLALGGTAAFFLMKKHGADEVDEEQAVTETAKNAKKKGGKETLPVYVTMDAFTVNLVPESGDQYVQLILSVEVADAHMGDKIKGYMPKIRNNVVMLLSSKKASELLTKEGKENLAGEIRDQMNQVLAPGAKGDDAPVREVLFTSFIIQ